MRFRSGKQTVGNSNRACFEFGQMKEKVVMQLSIGLRVLRNLTSYN